MYDLPGADGECGTLIDLLDDDDLEMMWEELDSFAVRTLISLSQCLASPCMLVDTPQCNSHTGYWFWSASWRVI